MGERRPAGATQTGPVTDEANGSRLRFARGTWWPIAAVLAVLLVAGALYRRSVLLEADATHATSGKLLLRSHDCILGECYHDSSMRDRIPLPATEQPMKLLPPVPS